MNELQQISTGLLQLAELNEPAVLATVVRVEGSAYRRPGARMLVTPAGRRVGCVSGGCLERDVRLRGARLPVGDATIVTYDSTADEETRWTLALGCNGRVDVLIEHLAPAEAATLARLFQTAIESNTPLHLATLLRSPHDSKLAVSTRWTLRELATLSFVWAEAASEELLNLHTARHVTLPTSHGEIDLLLERIDPPQPLVIFGGGWDAVPLLAAAKQLGWHVTIVDPRSAALTNPQFAGADRRVQSAGDVSISERTAAVIMHHDYDADRAALAALCDSPAGYVGVLGPHARTQRMMADLKRQPTRSLHAPVGLDIGAETPGEIALSVIAEIVAWRSGHAGGRLCERGGAIHEIDTPLTLSRSTLLTAEAV